MKKQIPIIILLLFIFAVISNAKNNELINIDSGKKGTVSFPHKYHQKIVKNCAKCHDLFAKRKGDIQSQISKNKLRKKQVMYDICISCHKSYIKDGKDSGPVRCSGCHK